jgi:hypothetical protein
MHTQQQIQDLGILNKGLQLLNIDVALKPAARLQHAVPCRFINNADGSLRWLWPASSDSPQFLRFQSGAERQKWSTQIVRAAFALRMPGLVSSGKTVIYTTAIGARQLQRLTDWAISTGKQGVNRKLLIWHEDKEGQSAFTKLSLSIWSAKSIYKERMAIQSPAPDGIVIPQNINTRCLAFSQQDVLGQKGFQVIDQISDLPLTTFQQWLSEDLRLQKLNEVRWYRQAQQWLQSPDSHLEESISEILLQRMRTLIDCMLPEATVPVSRAHGDFTPQNVQRRGMN